MSSQENNSGCRNGTKVQKQDSTVIVRYTAWSLLCCISCILECAQIRLHNVQDGAPEAGIIQCIPLSLCYLVSVRFV